MPEVPDPESLPTLPERLEAMAGPAGRLVRPAPPDRPALHRVDPVGGGSRVDSDPHQQLWVRADGELPDDALLHASVVAYASDLSLYDTILSPHRIKWEDASFMGASLDHCMWFHRRFRADEWLLYDTDSPVGDQRARAWRGGSSSTREGRLVVSVAQEGLVRFLGPTRRPEPV